MPDIIKVIFLLGNSFALGALLDDDTKEKTGLCCTILTTSTADSVFLGTEIAPQIYKNITQTSAYIESLSDEQLATLTETLEKKDFSSTLEVNKTLKKSLK